MGQQQLLLIVLGVIIVGIAVVVGINIFSASSSNANRDAVVSDLTNLGAMAQQYYRKPTAMGGGGNSFVGFTTAKIPASLLTNANGTYTVKTAGTSTTIVFSGTGKEKGYNGTGAISVDMSVWADSMKASMTN
jgi:Tfp pilus assembly protein PilE